MQSDTGWEVNRIEQEPYDVNNATVHYFYEVLKRQYAFLAVIAVFKINRLATEKTQ